MKVNKTYKGEYKVKHNGKEFTIQNMEIWSVEKWDNSNPEKWYLYNDDTGEFIASTRLKRYALRLIERNF